jgi:hypothetical protein
MLPRIAGGQETTAAPPLDGRISPSALSIQAESLAPPLSFRPAGEISFVTFGLMNPGKTTAEISHMRFDMTSGKKGGPFQVKRKKLSNGISGQKKRLRHTWVSGIG